MAQKIVSRARIVTHVKHNNNNNNNNNNKRKHTWSCIFFVGRRQGDIQKMKRKRICLLEAVHPPLAAKPVSPKAPPPALWPITLIWSIASHAFRREMRALGIEVSECIPAARRATSEPTQTSEQSRACMCLSLLLQRCVFPGKPAFTFHLLFYCFISSHIILQH